MRPSGGKLRLTSLIPFLQPDMQRALIEILLDFRTNVNIKFS